MANSCFRRLFFGFREPAAGDKVLQRKSTGLAAPCRDWHGTTYVQGCRSCGAFDTLPGSGWKGTFRTLFALIQICLQGELGHERVGGEVMGIQRFVLPACADLPCLRIEMCLGETPFERSQEFTRSTARSVQQRNNILSDVGVLVRALGGGTGDKAVCCWRWYCAQQFERAHPWASGMSCRRVSHLAASSMIC